MSTLCIPIPALHLDSTLGAAYIGNIVAAILFGVTNLQTYIYFERNQDALLLRFLIFLLWVLDGLHLALISHTMYFYTVTNFNNPLQMAHVTWSIMAHIAVTGVSDVIVRSIFAYRVWRVSQEKWWLVVAIQVPSLVTFAGSIIFPSKALKIGTYAGFEEISWDLYMSFGAGVMADLVIAISLCTILFRRRTGIRRTDSMVRAVMVYTINTGALTSLCAIIVLVTYATMPGNFVFICFYFLLPKLFLNSLLATLNAREKLRRGGTNSNGLVSIPLTSVVSSSHTTSKSTGTPAQSRGDESKALQKRMVEVQIHTVTDRNAEMFNSNASTEWKPQYPLA